ncbi:winged helix-turn-helix domain-containing protein [Kitasatospora sp. NPDC085464]|uniref:winged helix-turn-helix domain-containing protein n=1 Tax=Kitasatospora sp. NPDC085464 TaxID=3364063 RepID=UPI0037C9AAD7
MSSSSTATLPLPTATPHLRAVRTVPTVPSGPSVSSAPSVPPSVPGSVGDRWSAAVRPSHAGSARPVAAPTAAAPQPGAVVPPVPQALLAALPEGAAVVAALPQGVLPQGLLAQYGAQFGTQFGGANGSPMVGYLVLVPAESPVAATGPVGTAGLPGAAAAAVTVAAPGAAGTAGSSGGPASAGVRQGRPAGKGISVDTERRNAHVDGQLLDLTYLEFELLAHLTEHPQRVHTRDHLVSAVWGYGHVGDGRTVDVHVARLRRKLGPAYRDTIVTVRRVGYKYTPAGV